MAWPVATMEYSAPTTASHPLTADNSEQQSQPQKGEERNIKRRKTSSQQPAGQVNKTEMMTTDEEEGGITSQSSSQDMMTMDMDTTTSGSSSSSAAPASKHQYQRPSEFNNFNGNALSDEELVYQVLQSGAQTYAEVVQFCVSHGVSVSRILQMDLMSRLSYLRAA